MRIETFLKSMLEECELVFKFNEKIPQDRNLGKSIDGTMLFRAIAVSEQRIGEAAAQILSISEGRIAEVCPSIPWKEIRGLRNHFVHEYLSIDESIIINTSLDEIPALYPKIKKLLYEFEVGNIDLS